jgi:HK97 family phage portal protein
MEGKLQELFYKYVWDTRAVNLENPKTPINGFTLDQVFGGNISGSGRSISYGSALTLSAIYRAVSIKAGFISSMPFQVFRSLPNGDRVIEKEHPVSFLLSRKPNDKCSKVLYFDRAMQHFELLGNHFARIKRNGIGRVVSYELLHPDDVSVIEGDSSIIYELRDSGKTELVSSDNIIHVPNMGDWYNGKSVLSYMREDASLMMDIRAYGSSFFGNGGKPAGLLIPKTPTTPAQRQETKNSFRDAKGQGGEVAMPFGWEYKEISIPPKDADWVVSNDFAISDVARWFGVPTQKLGDSKVKYSNVEYMGIEFLQDTMAPIAAKFENEYTNKSFMLASEMDLYCEFNLDAYLRADSVSKSESLAKRVQNAMITPNEARKLDNRPAIEGGDDLFIQGATVPLRLQEQLYAKEETPTEKKTRLSTRKKIEKQVKEGIDPQLILEGILGNDGKGH